MLQMIDWNLTSAQIAESINGCGGLREGAPGGASLRGRIVAIARVRAGGTMSVYPPGTITRCDNEVWVQTGRGHLVIEAIRVDDQLQAAGAYFASQGLSAGDAFDPTHSPNSERTLSHAA